MTLDQIDKAARLLVSARRERRQIDRLPESCRPSTDDEALAIQQRVVALLDDHIAGWKCSLPRNDHAFLAPLPASTISRTSPCPIVPHAGEALIEPEIAVVLGKDLPPRNTSYDENEVRAAVAEARLVLELIGSRYIDPNSLPFPEFLADSINNQGFFVGPPVTSPFERPLETLTITVSGKEGTMITHDGRHPNGHPLRPLVWLANFCSSRGETLKAGTIVTTGSYAGILEVPLHTLLTVTYGDLGKLDVIFGTY
jgi:2-keto-4-pentenoate hydratase